MAEEAREELPPLRVVEAYVEDQTPFPLLQSTFVRCREDNDRRRGRRRRRPRERGEEDNEQQSKEAVDEPTAMAKLGLPISFSSGHGRAFSHRSSHTRSHVRDQGTASLISDVVSTPFEKPPSLVDSLQMSIEDVVEDEGVRVSNDQANHCADANPLASSTDDDDDVHDTGAAVSISDMVVAVSTPIQMLKLSDNVMSALGALLSKKGPSDGAIVENIEVMAEICDNVACIGRDDSTCIQGGVSFKDSESPSIIGLNLPEVESVLVSDSAIFEGSILRASDRMVEFAEQDNHTKGSSKPDVGYSNWSECWDSYYNRVFFYNADTQESTWEPPTGCVSVSVSQGSNENPATNGVITDFVTETSQVSVEIDSKTVAQVVSRCSKKNGTFEVLAKGAGISTVSGNTTLLVKDASTSGTGLDHEEIASLSCSGLRAVEADNTDSTRFPLMAVGIDDAQGREMERSMELSGRDPKSGCVEDPNWSACWDTFYSRYYYFNSETMESTWEPPKGFEVTAESPLQDIVSISRDPTHQSGRNQSEEQAELNLEGMVVQNVSSGTSESTSVEVPQRRDKYWAQRFSLFSKYDLGVKLDEEGWYSVTPEAIAKHQAACCKGDVIIDAFTGVGGNAIQFALAGHYVVAIDNNKRRLEYAHHNATIYGVADCIDFVLGDFFKVSSSMRADVIFLSPPWGGPDYLDARVYNILTMLQPKDAVALLTAAGLVAPNIMLYLPRNVDMKQLSDLRKTLPLGCPCEVEKIYLNGKLKAVTAYFGQFASTVK